MKKDVKINKKTKYKSEVSDTFYDPIIFKAVKFKKYPIGPANSRVVKYAIFCELDVDHLTGLGFKYSLIEHVEIDKNFSDIVRKFAGYQWPTAVGNIREYSPSPSALSLRIGTADTRTTDGSGEPAQAQLAHVFIRLSTNALWRFTEQSDAGREPFGTLEENTPDYVSDAIRVGRDGTNWDDDVHAGNCTVARFVADSRNLDAGHRIRFNINLDILDVSGRVIPIIIDPDVGYPGGNDGG